MLRHGRALSLAIAALLAIGVQQLGCSSDPGGPEPDTDGDGLSDAEELNVTGTSPLIADTDGDGLSDFQEVVTLGFDPNNDPYHFNPLVADLPQMVVEFVGPPILVFQWMDAKGTTYTLEQDLSDQYTTSVANSVSPMQAQTDMNSVSQTNMNQVSVTEPIGGTSSSGSSSGGSSGSTSGSASSSSGSGSSSGSSGSSGGDASTSDAASDGAADAPSDGSPDAPHDASADAGERPVRDAGAAPDASVAVDSGGGNAGASSSGGGGSGGSGSSSGATITFTNSVATTVNPSTSVTASITTTDLQMQQYSETLTQIRSIAANDTFTVSGAFLKVACVLHNSSDLAFRVSNVMIAANFYDPSGLVLAGVNLFIDESFLSTFQPFALAGGESTTPVTFTTMLLTMDTAIAILERSTQLILDLGIYEIDDASGKPYAFNTDAVGSKTALVAIDYGQDRSPELYQVATNANPAHAGVTAGTIFNDILRIPYTASPETGLTAVRELAVTTSGGPRWSVLRIHKEGPDFIRIPYGQGGQPFDFDDIELHAGDILELSFGTSDAPGDPDAGVPSASLAGAPPPDGGVPIVSYNPDAAPEVPTQYPDADRALQLPPDDASPNAFPPAPGPFGQGFPPAAPGPPVEGGPPALQP